MKNSAPITNQPDSDEFCIAILPLKVAMGGLCVVVGRIMIADSVLEEQRMN